MKRKTFLKFALIAAAGLCVLAGGIAVPRLVAQSTSASGQGAVTSFRAGINEVIVPITATDSKGRFIDNFVQSDFHVYDEGHPQKIDYFSHEQAQPVVIGFLLDMSNSMVMYWKDRYKESTKELILDLLPGDKKYSGYLITYGNKPELVVNTNSDPEGMIAKIDKMKPSGASALFDAIYMACTSRKTVEGEPYQPRRVLIVIGDGHDSASAKSLEEVTEIAQRKQLTIYAMNTTAFSNHTQDEDNLLALTAATGGRIVNPLGGENLYKNIAGFLSNPQDAGNYAVQVGTGGYTAEIQSALNRAVTDIYGEITTQYVIRYHPDLNTDCDPVITKCDPSTDKQYRHIKVTVGLPGVTLRYREGYYPYDEPIIQPEKPAKPSATAPKTTTPAR